MGLYLLKTIESIINNLLKQRASCPDGFTSEFYQIFKEEIVSIFYKFFQKIEAEGILPNSLYKASITVVSKPNKDITRKLQTNIS